MGPGRARRIIQIAATVDHSAPLSLPVLYALADDGSVWVRDSLEDTWRQVAELPPEEVP